MSTAGIKNTSNLRITVTNYSAAHSLAARRRSAAYTAAEEKLTKLTSAITSHDFDAISRIVNEEPSLIHDEVNGWLPIEWARRCGNPFTYARVIRLFGEDFDSAQLLQVLTTCIILISSNYFGGGTPKKAAKRAWEQIYEGKEHLFSKDEPDINLKSEQIIDLAYLIEKCGFTSKESFVTAFNDA